MSNKISQVTVGNGTAGSGSTAPVFGAALVAAINVANGIGTQYLALSCWTDSSGNTIDPTGTNDSSAAVQSAFNYAVAHNLTVLWDCPVYCQMGTTYTKTIFIPPGLNCQFTLSGVCINDSLGFPCFAAYNSSNWTFENFTFQYIASPTYGAFGDQVYSTINGNATSWNNQVATPYMTNNCNIQFSVGQTANWQTLNNTTALFLITGSCSNFQFLGYTNCYVPQGVNASHFIWVMFAFGRNWNSNQAIGSGVTSSLSNSSAPTQIYIQNLTLDGCCMGMPGTASYFTIDTFHSIRYSDFQTTSGTNVGSTGAGGGTAYTTPLSPPHAWYIDSSDLIIPSSNNCIVNFIDDGIYVGTTARRLTSSGYLHAFKFEAGNNQQVHCVKCLRPDGFIQVLAQGHAYGSIIADLVISSSSTLVTGGQSLASVAVSFPTSTGVGLNNVQVNVNVIDTATSPVGWPIQSDYTNDHQNVNIISNVVVTNYPVAGGAHGPYDYGYVFCGSGNSVKSRVTILSITGTPSHSVGAVVSHGGLSTQCDYDITIFGWPTITNSNITSANTHCGINGNNPSALGTNNSVRIHDVANQYEFYSKGAAAKVEWNWEAVLTPTAGATYATGLTVPTNFSAEYATWSTLTTFGDAINITAAGSGYTNGTYTNVSATGGSGSNLKFNITVSGGGVSAATVSANGTGYVVGDTLSVSTSAMGGTGSGFAAQITALAPTSISVGTSGNPTALLSNQNSSSGTFVYSPYSAAPALIGGQSIILTANGGNFTGTGAGVLGVKMSATVNAL